MPRYEVQVPFEAVRFESIGSSSYSDLPDTFELATMKVKRVGAGAFLAHLTVEAPSLSAAQQAAVDEVLAAMRVMATWGEAFGVRLGLGLKTERLPDEPPPPTPRTSGSNATAGETQVLVAVGFAGEIQPTGHAGFVKRRANVDFEKSGLSWRSEWPEWLPTALDLNHLAVISQDPRSSLATVFSALEVITKGIEGTPTAIIKTHLRHDVAGRLLEVIRGTLRLCSLDEKHIDRIVSRILDTLPESEVDRIVRALGKTGVEASSSDVIFVRTRRGSIVHPGRSNVEDLMRARNLAARWVQEALRNTLSARGVEPR